jgi:hypothetical protein
MFFTVLFSYTFFKEKEEAWEEYNREKTNPYQNLNPSSEHNLQLQFLLAQQQQQLNPQLMGEWNLFSHFPVN